MCNSITRAILFSIILFISNQVIAEDFQKYVGQSFVLPIPKCPVRDGFVNSMSYSCSSTKIDITNGGSSSPSKAMITSYFSGTEVIECFFQYIYYQNNYPRSGTSREYYRVTCRSNDISISGSRKKLSVGETMQMSYKFSHSTFDSTPQITWRSGSGVASVDYGGVVTALKPGIATITASSNLGSNVAKFEIEVEKIDPTNVTITPSLPRVPCDSTIQLYATVSPSGASQNVSWDIVEDLPDVATISDKGLLSGKMPGKITVKATAENGVYGTREVTIYEPSFNVVSSSPINNATSQNVFLTPRVTFSHKIYEGDNFNYITFKSENGDNVKGFCSISGTTISFQHDEPLKPNLKYTLNLPANSIKNKWGTHYAYNYSITFTTGNLEKLSLTSNIPETFIERGTAIKLTCNISNANIYYSVDGSTPTDKSLKYQNAIVLDKDIRLRAIAMSKGYENSDILSRDYYISNVSVVKRFPDTDTKMYEYKDINPYVTFSNHIEESESLSKASITKNGTMSVDGEFIVSDSSVFFIPGTPLEIGCSYRVEIPENSIVTQQGEPNGAISWTFNTGDYVTDVSTGSHELAAAIKNDGSLLTWGRIYESGNSVDGSCLFKNRTSPEIFIDAGVKAISSGYMHHAIIKNDSSLWMWGRQYCGEFGNNSTTGSAVPIKIMDGVIAVSAGGQSTSVIKADGTLWISGRNDFGQLGDGTLLTKCSYVKIMEDVVSATSGWCVTYAIQADGTLWAWGRNDKNQLGIDSTGNQLKPVKVLNDVAIVSTSATESKWTAAIKTDGTLWVWGEIQPIPKHVLSDVSSVAVGVDYVEAVKSDGTLWAFGNNTFGQLGNDTSVSTDSPIKIIEDVIKVASGGQNTMTILKNGSVWTWGRNEYGVLGNGSSPSLTSYNPKPTKIIEGRAFSMLKGITTRKNNYQLILKSRDVIDVMPIPLNAVYENITWKSTDEDIVSVTERGVIRGESLGETDIITTITNDIGDEFHMTSHVVVTDATVIDNPINSYNIKIWANNQKLYISGLEKGQNIKVYTLNGTLVYQGLADYEKITIPINNKGVYVVQLDKISKKVLVK